VFIPLWIDVFFSLLLDWCYGGVIWFRSMKTRTVNIPIGLILRCLLYLYAGLWSL